MANEQRPLDRIQPSDSLQVVWGQNPQSCVGRHRRKHNGAPDARVRESQQVADFMECDRFDVVLAGGRADAPGVFLVVEMEWSGKRVP